MTLVLARLVHPPSRFCGSVEGINSVFQGEGLAPSSLPHAIDMVFLP